MRSNPLAGLGLPLVLLTSCSVDELEPERPLSTRAFGEMASPYPYPVTGYFAYNRPPSDWPGTLDDMQRLGGDTVVTFGHTLEEHTEDFVKTDAFWTDARIGADHVVDRVRSRLQYARPSNEIDRIFTLRTDDHFCRLLRNSAYDVVPAQTGDCLQSGRQWLALVYRSGEPEAQLYSWADFATHPTDTFDVVIIAGYYSESARTPALLAEAGARDMDVFLGIPIPQKSGQHVDMSARPLYDAVYENILDFYGVAYAAEPAFAGVYHSLEVQMDDNLPSTIVDTYADAFTAFASRFPTRRTLLSPYMEARLSKSIQPGEAKEGFETLARDTGVDIIAPQDSRGTGKIGLFFDPSDASDPMFPPVQAFTGETTYQDAYRSSVREHFASLRDGVAELAAESPATTVELWANLEAFEPTPTNNPCGTATYVHPGRGRTCRDVLDEHVMHLGHYPSKIISFQWDGYYTTVAGGSQSLADELDADLDRPIIATVSAAPGGLNVRGYNLSNASVTMTYYDAGWQLRFAEWAPAEGWVDVYYHESVDVPAPMQLRFVPFTDTLAPGFIAYLNAEKNGKATFRTFHWDY